MKNKLIVQIVSTLLIVLFPTLLFASGLPDPGGNPDVPIDGGLSLLLAAGVAYGAKKGYDIQKKKKHGDGNDGLTEK